MLHSQLQGWKASFMLLQDRFDIHNHEFLSSLYMCHLKKIRNFLSSVNPQVLFFFEST